MTSPYPTRLRTLMGLTTIIKSVRPANSYTNDLSDFSDDQGETQTRVFRGRNVFGQDDPIPMVCILENPHTEPTQHESPRGSTVVIGPWEILIQAFVKDDKVNPSDPAHMLMAEVKQALIRERRQREGNPDYSLLGMGRAVTDIVVGTGVVRPPDDVSDKACFWLMLTLHMAEDMENPFA
jgi:hypothetical protein